MSFGCRRLGLNRPPYLNGTPIHTHTRPHLYTLVPTSFSQIELALIDLNFYNDGTPPKEGQCTPPLQKQKKKSEKERMSELT